jgi:hypothetical protein
MNLANPILLWSLLGLSVPIAIHLLSRKEGRIVKLGSIRHVQETSMQQFKGIKLNELLLLALRCALVFVFCLLLSGIRCAGISTDKWVVVEAGLENDPSVKSMLDSLKKDGYAEHQLQDGFPSIGHDSASHLNYWTLVEQLKLKDLTSAVVLSTNKFENFRSKRILLPPNIKWLAVPVGKIDFSVAFFKLNADSVYVRTGHSSADQTFFTTEKMKSVPQSASIFSRDSVRILIARDDKYGYDRKILMASLKTIQQNFPIVMEVRESNATTALPENCDWIFWLSDSSPSERHSSSMVILRPNSSTKLIDRVDQHNWLLTKSLNEEVALDQNLAVALAHLIIPSEKQQQIAQVNDKRTMPDSMAWSSGFQSTSADAITSNANRPLIICLIVLLLIERIIAYQRNQ